MGEGRGGVLWWKPRPIRKYDLNNSTNFFYVYFRTITIIIIIIIISIIIVGSIVICTWSDQQALLDWIWAARMVGTGSASRRPAICEIILITILECDGDWWCLRKTTKIILVVWNGRSEKGSIKASLPPFAFLTPIMTSWWQWWQWRQCWKWWKCWSDDNYNGTHRFLDDYQQSWDAGQEHCKDWGAGQLCFVCLYFGISVYL